MINSNKEYSKDAIIAGINSIEFTQIIEGIVLTVLVSYLRSKTNMEQTYKIITTSSKILLQKVYDSIWKPRCNDMIAQEKRYNITTMNKKLKSSKRNNNTQQTSVISQSTWKLWISIAANQGGHWSDFVDRY